MHRCLLATLLLLSLGAGVARAQPSDSPINADHPLLRGLVSWWKPLSGFTGGTLFYDLGPARNHLTLTNMGYSATSGWSTSTRRGGSWKIGCDDTDDYGTAGNPVVYNITQGAVAAWIYRNSNGFTDTVWTYAKGDASFLNYIGLVWIGGADTLRINVSATACGSFCWRGDASGITTGTWWHILVYGGTGGNGMYVNGLPVTLTYSSSSSANTEWFSNIYSVATRFDLCRDDGGGGLLDGAVDDVRIYNRVPSAQEVMAIYQQSLRGDPDLLANPGMGGIVSAGELAPMMRPRPLIYQ